MKTTRLFFTITLLSFWGSFANAQITQTLRGVVIDKQAESPLIGAAVVVARTVFGSPKQGVSGLSNWLFS